MNFFEAEDRAKRATVALVVLYLLAIVGVVAMTDGLLAGIVAVYLDRSDTAFSRTFTLLLPFIGGAVTLIVLFATCSKANELRAGGTVIGSFLDGRWLAEHPTDPAEVRLKNVVDEMALAAGVKSPAICVLDKEQGINSFAAGLNNIDPVIGVTYGCLTLLSRDELQAIVAHEFSHILHNDTTLNIRAYSLIYGLLAISVIGSNLVEASASSNDDDGWGRGNSGGFFLGMLAGFIMMVVGWTGGLMGRIIRAAIVRQREFLADAAAVQYTRNPESVASALHKMSRMGSHLRHAGGDEAEHFLFGPGSGGAWNRFPLTRTHPRTSKRIKIVYPAFQPNDAPGAKLESYDEPDGFGERVSPWEDVDAIVANQGPAKLPATLIAEIAAMPVAAALTDTANHVAATSPVQPVAQLLPKLKLPPAGMLAQLPDPLKKAAGEPESAAAVCFALAAADLPPASWASILATFADDDTTAKLNAALPLIKPLTLEPRLALLDMLIGPLQSLQLEEQTALHEAVEQLLPLTPHPDTIAMGVFWRLTRYLGTHAPTGVKADTWEEGAPYIAVLIATVAHLQHGGGILGDQSYYHAVKEFAALGQMPPSPPASKRTPTEIQTALTALDAASPDTRAAVLAAAAHIVASEQIPEPLADLALRMIADAVRLDLPDIFDRWV